VHLGQVSQLNVLGRIVVFDLPTSPIDAFQPEDLSLGDCAHRRDIWVPAVVERNWLIEGRFGHVDLDDCSNWF
jgi:hypothetical protein